MKKLTELKTFVSAYLSKVKGENFTKEKDFEKDFLKKLRDEGKFDVEDQLGTQSLNESQQKTFSEKEAKVPDLVVLVEEGFVPIELKFDNTPAKYEEDEDKISLYVSSFSDVVAAWAIFLSKIDHEDYRKGEWDLIKDSEYRKLWLNGIKKGEGALKLAEVWNARREEIHQKEEIAKRLKEMGENARKNMSLRRFKTILLLLLTLGVGPMWAGVNLAKNSHLDFYVDVSATNKNWQDHVALTFGNASSSIRVPGTHLANTRLWYCYLNHNWSDLYWMAAYDADWGTSQGKDYSDYTTYIGDGYVSAQYMPASYNVNANAVTLVTVGSASSLPTISLSTVNDNRNYGYLNYTINLESYVKTGAAAYGIANAKGAISASSYKINGQTSTTGTSASLSTSQNSTTIQCCRSASTTFNVETPSSGYEFVGWYDGSGSLLSDATNYTTYYPTAEGSYVRAYFAQTHTVTINPGVNGTVSVSGNKTIGQKGLSITATNTVSDYYFVGWVCTGGATVDDASAATTTIRATSTGTVTAKFVSKWAIRGSMSNDDWATYYDLTNKGSNTWSGKIHLSANSVYTFKVYDNPSGATWGYGSTDSYRRSYVGQTTAWGLASGEKELIIMTANEGDYTFSWNSSSKQLTVLYPEITHPNSNYVYFKNKPAGWSTVTAHIWGDGSVPSTGWDALPVLSTFSFDGDNYYYMALGSHTAGLVSDGSASDDGKKSADLSLSSHKGQWYDIATKSAQSSEVSSHWHDFTQTVTLNNQSATTAGQTNVTATYGSAMPSIAENLPEKTGYTFDGYFESTGGSGTKYYDADGTSAHAWNQTGASPSIYAKWTPNTYFISLENNGADVGYKGTLNTTVTYDAKTGMGDIIKPQKTHYEFGGYYTGDGGSGTQLIDADGKWLSGKAGYTDASGNWICTTKDADDGNTDGYDLKLYAKWIEILHDVTVAVSPAGAGSVQISSSAITELEDIGYATHSAEMTAVPTNAAWVFKEWQVTSNAHLDLLNYTTTGTAMQITATGDDQTLTAVFVKRYELVGSVWDGESNGGMPGWTYDGTGDFTINSFDAVDTDNGVDLSYSCMLSSNTAYKLRINDRGASKVYGKNDPTYDYYTLPANTSAELSDYGDGSEDVWIQTGDASGLFTFRITKMRDAEEGNRYYPTLSVERPQQVNFGWKYINIGGSLTSGDVGGTASVKKKSDNSDVSNSTWLPYGTVVTYSASPVTGYSVDWYSNNDYSTGHITSSYTFEHAGTSMGNGYVKFTELATKVSLENDGHGHVEIGDATQTEMTCGVTTTRNITAVPNTGYSFSSWTKPSGEDITLSATNTSTITVTALGSGLQEGQRVCANFSANSYAITLNNDHGGSDSDNGSATVNYDATALSVSKNASFTGWTLVGYFAGGTGDQVTDASGNLQASKSGNDGSVYVITNSDSKWNYADDLTLYAHWSRSVSLDREGGTTGSESVTVTYKGSSLSGFSAPTKTGYDFTGYYTGDNGTGTLVINTSGVLQANVSGYTNSDGQWTKTDATTLYAGWTAKTYTAANNIDKNGGDSHGTYTATYGATSIAINTAPALSGYDVEGYYTESTLNNKIATPNNNGTATLTKDFVRAETRYTDTDGKWVYLGAPTLYAKWSPKSYTLKLYRNDGTEVYSSITVTMGSSTCVPDITAPTRAGYSFGGYYTEESGGTKVINTDGSKPVTTYFDGSARWQYDGNVDLYAHWTPVALTFKADASTTAWNTAANWDPACVPTIEHDVTIKKAVTVSGVAEAKSIVFDGGSLSIAKTGALEVAGTITNTDASKINVAAGGALIFNNSAGTTCATVEMSMTSGWHMIAIPVGYTDVKDAFVGSGVYTYVWKYGEGWERRGYYDGLSAFESVLIYGSTGKIFSGALVSTADRSFTASYDESKESGNVTMYGNSWTAPIQISSMGLSSTADGSVHFFTGSGWDGGIKGDVIPALQGYAVLAKSPSGGTVSIPYSAVRAVASGNRNAALKAPKRTTSDIFDHITMYVSGNEWKTRIRLYENEQFSDSLDKGYEALHMEGEGIAGELYAQGAEKMNVLAVPDLEGTVVGFVPGQATNYTISFEGDGRGYYLNDIEEQQSTLIEEGNTYTFSSGNNNAARFIVSRTPINKIATGVDAVSDGVKARKQMINGVFYIIRDGRMYNAEGMLVK